jgi:hypothetical protein
MGFSEPFEEVCELGAIAILCRSALIGDFRSASETIAGLETPGRFVALVNRSRLWSACEKGLVRSGNTVPDFIAAHSHAERERAMLANTRVLALARMVFPCLTRHDIAAIAFKGPFHQRQLHGDWFTRRSSDLDILVPRASFERALQALESIGFRARSETSQWWKSSLGEVHLEFPGGGVIDLHHRLQQPGCPAPRDLDDFIKSATIERLGKARIAIPSLQHALLISALNFCKELFQRKASARYAFDFAAGLLRLPLDRQAEFDTLVHRQGLEGPVNFALTACDTLFGPLPVLPRAGARHATKAQWARRSDLLKLVFEPQSKDACWPRRRALLWQFCGGEVSARCSFEFAGQAGRIAFGEVLRRAAPAMPRKLM